MSLLFRIGCIVILFGGVQVATAQDARITSLTGSVLHLAPGESGTLRLRVQSAAPVWTQVYAAYALNDEYEFVPLGAAAGCAALAPRQWSTRITFDPVAAGGDLECVYLVHRAVGSINDLSIDMYPVNGSGIPNGGGVELRFGTVPDLRLDVRQESVTWLPDGRAQSLLKLTVQQSSGVALSGVGAGFCLVGSFPGFVMDGNIRGGCAGPGGAGLYCINGGIGFQMPTIPAQGSSSYHIQLTSREAYTAPQSYPIQLITTYMRDVATGGTVLTLSGAYDLLVIDMDLIFSDRFD